MELEEELESRGDLAKDFERLKANFDDKIKRRDIHHSKEIEAHAIKYQDDMRLVILEVEKIKERKVMEIRKV